MNAPIFHGGGNCRPPWPSGAAAPGWVPPPVWDDILYVGGENNHVAAANAIVINMPVGVVAGDTLIAFISWNTTGIWFVSAPAGWVRSTSSAGANNDGGPCASECWIKIAGAAEPANYSFGINNPAAISGAIVAYRNCMPLKPVLSSSAFTNSNFEVDIYIPLCNCIYSRSMLVIAGMHSSADITAVPALFTSRQNVSGFGIVPMRVADYLNPNAGTIFPGQMLTGGAGGWNQSYTIVLMRKYAYLTDEPRMFFIPASLFVSETAGMVSAKRTVSGRSVYTIAFRRNAGDVATGHIPLPIQWDNQAIGYRLVWYHETNMMSVVRWQIGSCVAGSFELWDTAIVPSQIYSGFGPNGAANILRMTPERWLNPFFPTTVFDPAGQRHLFVKVFRQGDNPEQDAYLVGVNIMFGCAKNIDLTPNPFNV